MGVFRLMSIFVPLLELALLFSQQYSLYYYLFVLVLSTFLVVSKLFLTLQDIDSIDKYNFETHNNTFN